MRNKSSYLQKEKVYAYKPTLTKEIVSFLPTVVSV